MANVLVLNQYHEKFPLLIAINRHAPMQHANGNFEIQKSDNAISVKHNDIEGTWLGVNKNGMFATLTGDEGQVEHQLLIPKLLSLPSVKDAVEFLSKEDVPDKLNTMNIVFGDQNSTFIAQSHYFGSFYLRKLPKGLTIIGDNFPRNYYSMAAIHREFDFSDKKLDWVKYYSFTKEVLKNKILVYSPYGNKIISSSVLAYDASGLKRFKFLNKFHKPAKYQDHISLYKDLSSEKSNGSV